MMKRFRTTASPGGGKRIRETRDILGVFVLFLMVALVGGTGFWLADPMGGGAGTWRANAGFISLILAICGAVMAVQSLFHLAMVSTIGADKLILAAVILFGFGLWVQLVDSGP